MQTLKLLYHALHVNTALVVVIYLYLTLVCNIFIEYLTCKNIILVLIDMSISDL